MNILLSVLVFYPFLGGLLSCVVGTRNEKARDFVVASVGLYLALANDFANPDYRRNEEIQSLAVIAHSIPTGNDSYRTQTDIIKVPKVGQSYIDHPALDLFS